MPLLLHRVPSGSEGPPGSQEPLGKWYVCLGVGVVPCRPRLSSLLLTQTPPPAPLGCPSRGHTWGESHVAHLGRYQWTHLGGGGESRVSLSFVGDLRSLSFQT